MELAPIILFGYNRPEHINKTIDCLKNNELAKESNLFVFIDGPKSENDIEKVNQVKKIANEISGFKNVNIYSSNENRGLANSVINGVTQIINKYGKVIVLEDDIITSTKFLLFMNEALNFYEYNDSIYSISGYNVPIKIPKEYKESVFLSFRPMSWGWATWQNRWENIDWNINDYDEFKNNRRAVDNFKQGGDDMPQMLQMQFEGKIDSWAIRWAYNQYKKNQYSVLPIYSLVKNIGWDSTGVHCGVTNKYDSNLDKIENWEFVNNLLVDREIVNNFRKFCVPVLDDELVVDYKKRSEFSNEWVSFLVNEKCLSEIIIKNYNVQCVSIYGYGTIGQNLYKQLKNEKILEVKYVIDKSTDSNFKNNSFISLDEYIDKYNKNELLIISPFYYIEEIAKEIDKKCDFIKYVSIKDLIDSNK